MTTMKQMSSTTRYCLAILAVVVTLFLVGAQRINANMRAQHEAQDRTEQLVATWHRQIASELPQDQQADWQANGRDLPIELLRACSIELPLKK